MAYDEELADRVQELSGLTAKKMFGGVGFLLGGHLAVGVLNSDLFARVFPEEYEEALREPGARPFNATKRVMAGWVMVAGEAVAGDDALADWVERGTAAAGALPPKPGATPRAPG